MKKNSEEEIALRIEAQVAKWDTFAKLAPTIFLVMCFILLLTDAVSFETVFIIGMIFFAFTAVTWWFWTIYSIRFLVRTLRRASNGLIEVSTELKTVKEEYKDLRHK